MGDFWPLLKLILSAIALIAFLFLLPTIAMLWGVFHPASDCPRGSVTQAGVARCL